MDPVLLVLSALVAILVAVLDSWLSSPSRGKPSRGPLRVVLAGAVCPAALVLAAPLPAGGFEAIVRGLPSCAQPVMSSMLARVDAFDCGRRDDGTLDLVCLCRSRPFKTEAKRAIGDVCHDPAEIVAARKWAIARCTTVLLQTSLASRARLPAAAAAAADIAANISSSSAANISSPSAEPPVFSAPGALSTTADSAVGGTDNSSSSSSSVAFAGSVFDIDDDEDWTAGAGIVRPVVALVVVMAVSVGVVVL